MAPERALAAARAVAAHLARQALWQRARRLVLYAAIDGELPTAPLAELAVGAGKACLWPRLAGDVLEFAPARVEELVSGRYGVPAPAPGVPATRLDEGDLVLVPGVAFDRRGRRLGRGGGHYDRALARAGGAVAVGVGYAFQQVEEVPVEAHDRPVQAWLCETGFAWSEGT